MQALLYHLSVLEEGGAAADRARWKAQQLRDGCARSLRHTWIWPLLWFCDGG